MAKNFNMDKLCKILSLAFLLCFVSCEFDTESQSGETTPTTPITNPIPDQKSDTTKKSIAAKPLKKPECEIKGEVLEENLFWAKNENLVLCIAADQETEDADYGESHRALEVYDGTDCERIFRNILPVNRSPDFPYYLSDVTYNKVNQVVAIRGFSSVYIFDLIKKQLSKPLIPKYLNERFGEDAQSGMIQRLELWEEYLIGYATSEGCFVFDISDPMNPKSVLPAAEFSGEYMPYHSLFFLKSEGKGNQAILPSFDLNTGDFNVNPVFDKPLKVETKINKNFRDNQFLVIKELLGGTKNRPIGIDMKTMKRIDIPADIAAKKDTEIIGWMKNQ